MYLRLSFRTIFLVLLLGVVASGCGVNPVTGKREITFVSEAQELEIGQQNYAPMQQAEGGEFDIDPELSRYVSEVGQKLAAVSDRDLPYEFVVLNSSVPNAWALPGGKIAINRGLLTEMEDEAELAAVIGHEIVHAAARHSARQMERGTLLQVAVVGTAIAAGSSGYGDLAMGGASIGAQLISQSYGRSAELESDLYGMRYMSRAGYDPQGAVRLQETFVRLNDSHSSDWVSGLFASHPPSRERVSANIATAKTLPPGGMVGRDRYQAAIRKTVQLKPAYDAYDNGREALGDKNTDLAAAKAAEAIRLFPDEANFYALRGDARYIEGQYGEAIKQYDSAIRRRDDFFQYYLQRGLAREKLDRNNDAIADLEKSNTMFPTAIAYYALGNIAVKQNRKSDAIEYYGAVAGGNGDIASAAQASLIRLDLEDNPGKYLQARCFVDDQGNLGVSIGNGTPVTVSSVRFIVEFRTSSGTQRRENSVPGTIRSGEAASVRTGLGPYNSSAGCPVAVSRARIVE